MRNNRWNTFKHRRTRIQSKLSAREAQYQAQQARDDLRAIIDGLSDELVVIGVNRQVLQANKVVMDRYADGEDIIGLPCHEVFYQNNASCALPGQGCPLAEAIRTKKPAQATYVQNTNGRQRYLNIIASPMFDGTDQVTRVIELRHDVTKEKEIEASLVRRNQQLSILNAVATTTNQSLDLGQILGRTLDEVLTLTGVDMGAIFLQEETIGTLELLAHQGLSEEAARLVAKFGMLDGSCGGIIESGQVIVIPDISRYRGLRAGTLKREKLSTLVHVPLAAKGCILGSMCVGTQVPREFSNEEQKLLTAIGNQIAGAIENARLYAELQHKEKLRGQLLNKIITAQEEERKRIARELHDETSQALTALLFAVEEAGEMDDLTEIKTRLDSMKNLASTTLQDIYKLIFDLRPTMLDHLGLVPALRSFAQSRLKANGVRVALEEVNPLPRLPNKVETALFRIVQELLNNIAKHAAARNAEILIDNNGHVVTITVTDDGIGFDMVEITLNPNSGCGLGLIGMLERVELLGGEMEFNTAPGFGTTVKIEMPVAQEVSAHA